MSRRTWTFAGGLGLVLFLSVPMAEAQTASEWQGLGFGAKVSTLGLGMDVTVDVFPPLKLRYSGNWLGFNVNRDIKGINYNNKVDMATHLFLLDWHPIETDFRLSAGVTLPSDVIQSVGSSAENLNINGTIYPGDQVGTLTGTAQAKKVAPYVGLGFGNAVDPEYGWTFVFDLGVIFQTFQYDISADGPLAQDPQFQKDLASYQGQVQDWFNQFGIYPYVAFGVAYHF